MTDLSRFELVILDDLRQNGGTPIAHVPLRSAVSIDLDLDDKQTSCLISVPTHDEEGEEIAWVRDVARGQAIYLKTPFGEEYDWRIEETADRLLDAVMHVHADPPDIDFVNAGAWYELVGGVPSYKFSAANENGTELLTRVETFMALQGFGYIDVGTVDSSLRMTFDVEGNCLQIIDTIVSTVRSAGETAYFVFRPTASSYEMDIVEDPSYGAEQGFASEGLNILDLTRHRGRDLITVMTTRGGESEGFRMPLGAGFWRVNTAPAYEELDLG